MNGRRKFAVALLALAGALSIPTNAFAHAVVYPKTSEQGAYEKYVLRVPNERDIATTRVEIHFPRSVRIVSFGDVPGWTLEILADSAKHIVGAAWTGSLGPQRFVEFPFVGVNPKSAVKLVWPVFQTYSSGERVDWTGNDDAKNPASATTVGGEKKTGTGIVIALWVCIAAVILSLLALAMALRPERVGSGFQPGT